MSLNNIVASYEKVTEVERWSYDYWYLTNGKTIVRRRCKDVDFLIDMFRAINDPHDWCLVANLYNTKIVPFMLHEDYVRLMDQGMQASKVLHFFDNFTKRMHKPKRMGAYVVWSGLSVNYFAWSMYLYMNLNYKISNKIPLCKNTTLGDYNLLTNSSNNIDISCKIYKGTILVFSNTNKNPIKKICTLTKHQQHEQSQSQSESEYKIFFSGDYVITKNTKQWMDYLLNNNEIHECVFGDDYHFVTGEKIVLNNLRWSQHQQSTLHDNMDIDESVINDDVFNEDLIENTPLSSTLQHVTPCSVYEKQFCDIINQLYKTTNELMQHFCTLLLDEKDLLKYYVVESSFTTFYILVISFWQYTKTVLNITYQKLSHEDILYFVKVMCDKVDDTEYLYTQYLIYVSSKEAAAWFFDSLNFFVLPSQGIERFLESIACYFVLHLNIQSKTNSWAITSSSIKESDCDIGIKSMGFYKKLKIGGNDYIFNGTIYQHYNKKKDNVLAVQYAAAPEINVSEIIFNKTLNFYMTQEGLFDVCRKKYLEPCPFVVLSTMKKNFISKDQQFLDKHIYKQMYQSINCDLSLLKIYHAKFILDKFYVLTENLRDCVSLPKMWQHQTKFHDQWSDVIKFILYLPVCDLIIIMIRLNLHVPLNNIIKPSGFVLDVMCLQVVILVHLLWPTTNVETLAWALLLPTKQDFLDYLEDHNYDNINLDCVYENKKRVCEVLHKSLLKIEYNKKLDILKIVQNTIEEINDVENNNNVTKKNKYEPKRLVKNTAQLYYKFLNLINQYNVWTDNLIEHKHNDTLIVWLMKFYMRIFLLEHTNNEELKNILFGFVYYRLLTNFHVVNTKVLINFCASLAIPMDNEKLCLVLSSKPNIGKSSFYDILGDYIVYYIHTKERYKNDSSEKNERVKALESQLYVMNEAKEFTNTFIKTNIDSTKIDQARCLYGLMEKYYGTYKVLICNNNEKDKIFLTDMFDDGASKRLGQMYFDHEFESIPFCGSLYYHFINRKYPLERDIKTKLKECVKSLLANALMYNSNPLDGLIYYKDMLKADDTYKYNMTCLKVFNNRKDAMVYTLKIKVDYYAPEFNDEKLIDIMRLAEYYVKEMLHPERRKQVSIEILKSDFKSMYDKEHYDVETRTYNNLYIALDERYFNKVTPTLKANVNEYW